jgi:hypothetical protein
MGCQSNQPLLAGGSTSGMKQKPYLAASCIASVVIVKQQDGDKKVTSIYPFYLRPNQKHVRRGGPKGDIYDEVGQTILLSNSKLPTVKMST